ncbi:hypothetical protein CAPTEDRAFT_213576 [Capitella teleta]|uniref:Cyclic nucleotide-binding domain-containing protein n=1 Tax=Capitella teleta TaxID=283909 RepID=R7VCS4_CAPTE|nr:hypothetical protein CAPTEDRAFT_213576 [Capitella teleta]|eukprot:ELU16362.1 hypothetical protein CAPTEDRAFT_213576 [Capitella teleta]
MPPRFRCRKKRTQCEICVIAPSETIGDIEVSFGLKTFSQTVMCCSGDSEFYVLNYRNYEQLIAKRNSFTVDVIKRGAQEKLRARMNGSCGRKLRLFHTLLEREENPEPPPCNTKKKDPTLITPEIDFLPQLGAIIDIFGQGTVFYRNRMREMAKMRAKERATFRGDPGLGLRFPTGIPPHQQPRRPSSYDQNNDRVQKTFANQLDNEYDDVEGDEEGEDWHTAIACYSDFDSSDRAMRLLEDKIDAWHAAIETDKNNSIRIESKRTNSRPPSGAIKLKRVHLDHMKGLLPGRKVIVRPRQLSDAAKLLADERPPSELRASSSLRPASASMSRERRARSSLSSSHLSKEAPAENDPIPLGSQKRDARRRSLDAERMRRAPFRWDLQAPKTSLLFVRLGNTKAEIVVAMDTGVAIESESLLLL